MEFSASDLLWTKNVTREKGNGWAYMEYDVGDTFELNFPLGRARMGITSAKTASVNELILLVQSIKLRSLGKPGTYISHIVTPIDKDIHIAPEGSHPVMRLVTFVAKDEVPIQKPSFLDFREPNRGWTCQLDLIKPFERTGISMTLAEKQKIFWDLFHHKDAGAKDIIANLDVPFFDPVNEPVEGDERFKFGRHKYYERDPKIIAAKKA